jgi:hypothetical protein
MVSATNRERGSGRVEINDLGCAKNFVGSNRFALFTRCALNLLLIHNHYSTRYVFCVKVF